ncbi:TNF receptor-associated factor 3-like [Mytilus californianus]|uniref:TNF receptor-associated factor 3-like n=1 Tax=Mytilus californianus TaxID=6549 RepID=UPI00224875B5|nr:TNF receptor-associated factor 3-like [Mytilus californianus]XP_052057911.1 TNF receptor-associated factor 3-like [Mytilus californianus]
MSSISSRSIISTPVEIPEFVEIDLRNNSCPICRNVLRDCVQLPCGHKTCESCIDQLFNNSISEGTCPVNDEDCFSFSRNDVVPDYGTRREILKSKVYCPYKTNGCATVIEWQKLQNHKESCEHKPRECPNKNDGCQAILSFKDITDHITNHCLYSLVSCSHCQSPVMRKDLQNHHDDCTRFPISCKFHCDVGELPREEMKVHENSCPKKLAKCPYASAGCTFEGKENEIKEHEKTALVYHLSLNQDYAKNMEQQNFNIQQEMQILKDQKVHMEEEIIATRNDYRTLVQHYEGLKKEYVDFQMRVVSTVEKVFGMEELLKNVPSKHTTDNLGRELRSLKDNQEELNRKLSDFDRQGFTSGDTRRGNTDPSTTEALKKQISNLEKQAAIQDIRLAELDLRFQILETASYNGILIWKIMDFARRKNDAVSGRTYSLFSQPFYTGRFGYKMCGRVYLNGDGMGKGTHLSLFFVVMKGEHDALMPWPFQQNIQMGLLDQQDGSQPVSDSFRPDTSSSSFQRPTTDMNTAVGCPMFVSHAKLETRKYLRDDTIFLKIAVDTSGLPHH